VKAVFRKLPATWAGTLKN